MMWTWLGPLLGILAIALVVLVRKPLKTFGRQVQMERARELFNLQRELLHDRFLAAASATGKPRGLRWKECQWDGDVEFARDRRSGQIAALVPVTIEFEAIAGSDMEGLPAVGNLRNASGVFYLEGGRWRTTGRAVFNLNPCEALEHFKLQYERVEV